MKPKKNRIYCPLANRAKMLFESKDEADRFIQPYCQAQFR